MDLIIMENGKRIRQMEKASSKGKMGELIREIFKMIFSMVTESTQRKIRSLLIKADLISICNMAMELKFAKGNTSILGILKMILKTVMVPLYMIMGSFIKEPGKMENLMDKELIKVLH
jgi:hydrogenase-4 membrane subunit HyfE